MRVATEFESRICPNDAMLIKLLVVCSDNIQQCRNFALQSIHSLGYPVEPTTFHVCILFFGIQPLS